MKILKLLVTATILFIPAACSVNMQETVEAEEEYRQNAVLLPLDEPFYADEDVIRQLESLGYLGGHDERGGPSGVLIHDKEKSWNGYNLVISGHGPEVDLISMDGKVLHTWHCPRNRAFPDSSVAKHGNRTRSFRRAYVLPNGDLIGIYNGTGMVRLTWDSQIVWAQGAMAHHDLAFGSDGTIFTFVQRKRLFVPFNPNEPVYDEFIVTIDGTSGTIQNRFSLLEAFYHSRYSSMLKKIPASGDIFHANTIVYIGPEHTGLLPIYQSGHLMVCMRNMDAIAIVNPETRNVTWALTGMWSFQHEPSILNNGNILLFDNAGHYEHSKVMEFHPFTQEIVWGYYDSPETPFFTSTSGSCHRLPNGNTLIVESNRGRAFEVLPDGTHVWEYSNIHRWGSDNHLIATIFDMQRLGYDYFDTEISCILNTRNSGMFHTR